MRLFHVSEEENLQIFVPRPVSRTDLDLSKSYVWTVNERCLPVSPGI